MAKKSTYKGKTSEELSSLTMEEMMPYISSRARRSVKRASNRYKKLTVKVRKAKKLKTEGKDTIIKTHVRDAVIMPEWVGVKFGVYNGKEFKNFEVVPEMIGKRLGEFSHPTGRVAHSGPGVGATRGSKFIPLK